MRALIVSIVIPAYNEEKVIEGCIRSLLSQTYPEREIIVVDDGSTDKTLDILSRLVTNSGELKVLQQDHQGPGAARNLGADQARGKILVFVDADMIFDKRFIFKLTRPINLGRSEGATSKEEYVANWDNIWARCWNISEGWPPKRRHRLGGGDVWQQSYDFLGFALTQKSLSLNEFRKYQARHVNNVFRAILKSEFVRVGGYTPGGYTDDHSLAIKLGYKPVETLAKFYHNNPASLGEVFSQAVWIGKRGYKLGPLGFVYALCRSSLPVSIIIGAVKSIQNREPRFFLFKLFYNMGIFWGITSYLFSKKGAK